MSENAGPSGLSGTSGTGELVHYYSYATGVSLELPVGFEAVGQGDPSAASYAELGDDDVTPVPGTQLLVQVVGAPAPGAVDALVTALEEGGEVLERRERVVDEERVVSSTLRRPDGMLVLAAAVATDHRLIAITGLARDADLVATYDAAIDSIRFIEL